MVRPKGVLGQTLGGRYIQEIIPEEVHSALFVVPAARGIRENVLLLVSKVRTSLDLSLKSQICTVTQLLSPGRQRLQTRACLNLTHLYATISLV